MFDRFQSHLKHQFSPEGYLSIYLVLGILLLLLSAAAFSSLAEDVATNERIVWFDSVVVNAIHANTNPTLIQLMIVTSLAGGELPVVITVGLAVYFIWRRRGYDLALLILAEGGAELLNTLLKFSFHRLRPLFTNPIVIPIGFSFPSGHAMGSMAFYGLIAYLLMRNTRRVAERILITLIFLLIVELIGFSRIYLGVHYPSDVLGGYIAGLGWLAFTISAVDIFRRRRRQASHGSGVDRPGSKRPSKSQ
jgi:membrane-associated phospholipid phosphatase